MTGLSSIVTAARGMASRSLEGAKGIASEGWQNLKDGTARNGAGVAWDVVGGNKIPALDSMFNYYNGKHQNQFDKRKSGASNDRDSGSQSVPPMRESAENDRGREADRIQREREEVKQNAEDAVKKNQSNPLVNLLQIIHSDQNDLKALLSDMLAQAQSCCATGGGSGMPDIPMGGKPPKGKPMPKGKNASPKGKPVAPKGGGWGTAFKVGGAALVAGNALWDNSEEIAEKGAVSLDTVTNRIAENAGELFDMEKPLLSLDRAGAALGLAQNVVGDIPMMIGTNIGKPIRDAMGETGQNIMEELFTGFGLWGETSAEMYARMEEEDKVRQEELKKKLEEKKQRDKEAGIVVAPVPKPSDEKKVLENSETPKPIEAAAAAAAVAASGETPKSGTRSQEKPTAEGKYPITEEEIAKYGMNSLPDDYKKSLLTTLTSIPPERRSGILQTVSVAPKTNNLEAKSAAPIAVMGAAGTIPFEDDSFTESPKDPTFDDGSTLESQLKEVVDKSKIESSKEFREQSIEKVSESSETALKENEEEKKSKKPSAVYLTDKDGKPIDFDVEDPMGEPMPNGTTAATPVATPGSTASSTGTSGETTRVSSTRTLASPASGSASGVASPGNIGPSGVSTDPGADLGSLSAKYESGNKGSGAVGFDNTGGTSYGKYQIATRTGTMKKFMEYAKKNNPEVYERLNAAGPADSGKDGAFAQEWKKLASEGKMGTTEHDFIKASHYDVGMKGIKNDQLKESIGKSKALQEIMWSTSVQHGGGGAAGIFNKVYKDGMSEDDLIKSIYAERGTRFGSSSENVQKSVQNRFEDEQSKALQIAADQRAGKIPAPGQAGAPTGKPGELSPGASGEMAQAYKLKNLTATMSTKSNAMNEEELAKWQTQSNAGIALGNALKEMRGSGDKELAAIADKISLTSGNKGEHVKGSQHYKGNAFDFNRMDLSEKEQEIFKGYAEKQGLKRDAKDSSGKIEPWHYTYRGKEDLVAKQKEIAEKMKTSPPEQQAQQDTQAQAVAGQQIQQAAAVSGAMTQGAGPTQAPSAPVASSGEATRVTKKDDAYSEKRNALFNNPKFMESVNEFSKTRGVDPNNVLKMMKYESRYDPSVVNNLGYKGLFQVGKAAFDDKEIGGKLKEKGFDYKNFEKESPERQMEAYGIYYDEWQKRTGDANKIDSAGDFAALQLAPGTLKNESGNMYKAGTKGYASNAKLDINKDGTINKEEYGQKMNDRYGKDKEVADQIFAQMNSGVKQETPISTDTLLAKQEINPPNTASQIQSPASAAPVPIDPVSEAVAATAPTASPGGGPTNTRLQSSAAPFQPVDSTKMSSTLEDSTAQAREQSSAPIVVNASAPPVAPTKQSGSSGSGTPGIASPMITRNPDTSIGRVVANLLGFSFS